MKGLFLTLKSLDDFDNSRYVTFTTFFNSIFRILKFNMLFMCSFWFIEITNEKNVKKWFRALCSPFHFGLFSFVIVKKYVFYENDLGIIFFYIYMKQYETKTRRKNDCIIVCEICDFKCSKRSDLNRHVLTRKHEMKQKTPENARFLFHVNYVMIIVVVLLSGINTYWHANTKWNKMKQNTPEKALIRT